MYPPQANLKDTKSEQARGTMTTLEISILYCLQVDPNGVRRVGIPDTQSSEDGVEGYLDPSHSIYSYGEIRTEETSGIQTQSPESMILQRTEVDQPSVLSVSAHVLCAYY